MSDDLTLVHRQPNAGAMNALLDAGVHPLLARLYAARGVTSAEDIDLSPAHLLPVDSLRNARELAHLLADCVKDQHRVLIISDYDCDGATAGSVLIEAFRACGMNHGILVPDRLRHGYGLTPSIVDEAAQLSPKPRFIITVDNGISSHAGIQRAKEHGIEVLVTDHHLCPEVLPDARLIVNPQQPGDSFASKNVAGCGVAWYVAVALHEELTRRGAAPGFDPMALTPLVAIGTVADVVQLDRNNRILVSEGLARIRAGQCAPGILALANVAKRNHELLTCSDVGFGLGPRINAAGRMAHMSSGITCLTTRDHAEATALALQLDEINKTRRDLQKDMVDEANAKVQTLGSIDSSSRSLVVYEPQWHEGVVGIVAGRLKDEKHRPTFVLCDAQDGGIKGSGRSIEGLHLKHALDQIHIEHPGLLLKFGGHAMAAGVTIDRSRLAEFQAAFERVCRDHVSPQMLERKLHHDGPIPAAHMTPQDVRHVEQQVWGQGFAAPLFADDFQVLSARTMGQTKEHLRLTVGKDKSKLNVIAWGEGHQMGRLPKAISLVYRPCINEWNGTVSVELMAEHFRAGPDLQAHNDLDHAKATSTGRIATGAEQSAAPVAAVSAAERFKKMLNDQRQQQSIAASASPVLTTDDGQTPHQIPESIPQTSGARRLRFIRAR